MRRCRPQATRLDWLVLATLAFGAAWFAGLTVTLSAPMWARALGVAYVIVYGLGAIGMARNRRWLGA